MSLLDVQDLQVKFSTPDGQVTAVNNLTFSLDAGETLGLVGESGSGKSQTAFALMGLLAKNGKVGGKAYFEGQDVLGLSNAELNRIRAEKNCHDFSGPNDIVEPLYESRCSVDGGVAIP